MLAHDIFASLKPDRVGRGRIKVERGFLEHVVTLLNHQRDSLFGCLDGQLRHLNVWAASEAFIINIHDSVPDRERRFAENTVGCNLLNKQEAIGNTDTLEGLDLLQ
jgi:hypothetical protein